MSSGSALREIMRHFTAPARLHACKFKLWMKHTALEDLCVIVMRRYTYTVSAFNAGPGFCVNNPSPLYP